MMPHRTLDASQQSSQRVQDFPLQMGCPLPPSVSAMLDDQTSQNYTVALAMVVTLV